LLVAIDTASVFGLRDRGLTGLMVFTFAIVGAAIGDDGRGIASFSAAVGVEPFAL
jgi:hypothetical protein